jgi:hypothetical protein
MASSKKVLTMAEIVESHKPKNFKYKFIIKDDTVYDELIECNYDLEKLDTIRNDKLVNEALKADFTEYQRETVARAKEPTLLDDGIILSKKMITKADKKLYGIMLGFFDYEEIHYVAIKFKYERFDILEIFVLT